MTDTATTDVAATVDTYIAMWNETDATRRRALIEQAWANEGRYLDPLLEADGHDALSEMVAGVQAHYVGHRFQRTSGVDTHHDQVRFAWDLRAPDGTLTVAGVDVGVVTPDGKLRTIVGFFGELPEKD